MSTRGAYGFHKNGTDKITYNGSDSYPSSLGYQIVDYVRNHSISQLNEIFDRIKLVSSKEQPTIDQIQACKPWHYDATTWRDVLIRAEGDLYAYDNGLEYMVDNALFLKESLYCEWAYVINLNDNTLEVYEGFTTEPQDNRYALTETPKSGYFNCKLLISFPLESIPYNWEYQVNQLCHYNNESPSSDDPRTTIDAAPMLTGDVLTAASDKYLVLNANHAVLCKSEAESLIEALKIQVGKMSEGA